MQSNGNELKWSHCRKRQTGLSPAHTDGWSRIWDFEGLFSSWGKNSVVKLWLSWGIPDFRCSQVCKSWLCCGWTGRAPVSFLCLPTGSLFSCWIWQRIAGALQQWALMAGTGLCQKHPPVLGTILGTHLCEQGQGVRKRDLGVTLHTEILPVQSKS